jgi:hypothetical protein
MDKKKLRIITSTKKFSLVDVILYCYCLLLSALFILDNQVVIVKVIHKTGEVIHKTGGTIR